MRIISHHVRFTRFVITSTVEETTFDSDEATFEAEQTSFEAGQTSFEAGQACCEAEQVCSASNEVSSGSRAIIRRMNTTLSEAVTTTFTSDEPFFTTEQVTSVAEEIIGDVPVMSLSTINKLKGEKTHDPHPMFSRIRISKRSGTYGNHRRGSQRTARQESVLEPAP